MIKLTDNADIHLSSVVAENKVAAIRLAVNSGGCSGFSYNFDYVKTPDEKDKKFYFEDVKVCVDIKSYLFLNSSTPNVSSLK